MRASPSRPPRLLTRLLGFWRLGPRRSEVEEDLAELFHERAADRGVRHAQLRYLIDVLSVAGRTQQTTFGTRPLWRKPTGLFTDVLYATRLFRRQPGIVGMTIAGLAIAIGVTTAVLTLVNAVTFRDTGVEDPGSVFRVLGPPWTYPDYLSLRDSVPSVTAIATGWGAAAQEFRDRSDADRADLPTVVVAAVSGNYFQALGVHAALGRLLTPADDRPAAQQSVVLSHASWLRLLAGDEAILGKTVWLANRPYTVIGVTARAFSPPGDPVTPGAWTSRAADIYSRREAQLEATRAAIKDLARGRGLTPADQDRLKALNAELVTPRQFPDQNAVFVRARSGVSRERAEGDLATFMSALAAGRGHGWKASEPVVGIRPINELDPSDVRIIALASAPAFLLIVLACANVTNLLLASTADRHREIGTRLALGASRARIGRQLLTESLLLCGAGGAAGLVIAGWLASGIASNLALPGLTDAQPSRSVYLCAMALTVVLGLVAGFIPVRYVWRRNRVSVVRANRLGSPSGPGPRKTHAVLVVAQTAASIVLMILSALFVRALVFEAGYDHGADVDRLLNVSLTLARRGEVRRNILMETAAERIRQIPGVAAVASVDSPPFQLRGAGGVVPGTTRQYRHNGTSPEYFDTVGARLIRGRTYSREEARDSAPVAVITHVLARDFWGTEDPIGSSLERIWGPDDPPGPPSTLWNRKPAGTRIIGVVQETTSGQPGVPTIYLPLRLGASSWLVVRVREGWDPAQIARPIHAAIRAIDPEVSRTISLVSTLRQRRMSGPRTLAVLGSGAALTALLLAVVGLFAVTAFAVAQRRHEVSVRLALGASGRQVVSMLLRDSLRPVVVGLMCGVGLSFLADRTLRSFLTGISPRDPLAIGTAVAILLLAGAIAAYLPARHAARVRPAEMLKQG